MSLYGPDGARLESTNPVVADEELTQLTDEQAEALGAQTEDKDARDELGVPYFYSADHADEGTRGMRIPPRERKRLRNKVKERLRAEKIAMAKPCSRGEMLALHENAISPLGRQLQSLVFHVKGLTTVLQAKGCFTEAELTEAIRKQVIAYRTEALKLSAEAKGIKPEDIENAMKIAEQMALQEEGVVMAGMDAGASYGENSPEGRV